jgi:hypothetical protein
MANFYDNFPVDPAVENASQPVGNFYDTLPGDSVATPPTPYQFLSPFIPEGIQLGGVGSLPADAASPMALTPSDMANINFTPPQQYSPWGDITGQPDAGLTTAVAQDVKPYVDAAGTGIGYVGKTFGAASDIAKGAFGAGGFHLAGEDQLATEQANAAMENAKARFTGEPVKTTPFEEGIQALPPGLARIGANIPYQIAGMAPKLAALALVPGALPAQMASSGALFGLDDNGNFSLKEAGLMALLPGVSAAGRLLIGKSIAAGIESGVGSLEKPAVQKALTIGGDQVVMDAYMIGMQSKELADQKKTNPTAFWESVGNIVGQNLGFGALHLRGGELPPDKSGTQAVVGGEVPVNQQLTKNDLEKAVSDRINQLDEQLNGKWTMDKNGKPIREFGGGKSLGGKAESELKWLQDNQGNHQAIADRYGVDIVAEKTVKPTPETSTTEVAATSKSGDTLPDYDPGDIGSRARLNKKKSEGLSHDEAVAQLSKESDSVAEKIGQLSYGTRVRNKSGMLFENISTSVKSDWHYVDEETGKVSENAVTDSMNLRGGKIERYGVAPKASEVAPKSPQEVNTDLRARGYSDLHIAKLTPDQVQEALSKPVPTQAEDAVRFWQMQDSLKAETDPAKKMQLYQQVGLESELIKNRNQTKPGMPPKRPSVPNPSEPVKPSEPNKPPVVGAAPVEPVSFEIGKKLKLIGLNDSDVIKILGARELAANNHSIILNRKIAIPILKDALNRAGIDTGRTAVYDPKEGVMSHQSSISHALEQALGDVTEILNSVTSPVVPGKPTLLEFAKSKLSPKVAAKITTESQAESFRAQWEKEYPVTKPTLAQSKKTFTDLVHEWGDKLGFVSDLQRYSDGVSGGMKRGHDSASLKGQIENGRVVKSVHESILKAVGQDPAIKTPQAFAEALPKFQKLIEEYKNKVEPSDINVPPGEISTEFLPPEDRLPQVPEKSGNLTSAQQGYFDRLNKKQISARDRGGPKLTSVETQDYNRLLEKVGQGKLFNEPPVKNDLTLEGQKLKTGEHTIDDGQGTLLRIGDTHVIPEGVSRVDAQAELARLEAMFPGARPSNLVRNYHGLPDSVHKTAYSLGSNPIRINAAVSGGKAWFVLDNMNSLADFREKWFHEQAGHFATDKQLGPKLDNFMGQVHDSFAADPVMVGVRSRYKNADAITLGREFIAKIAENPQANPGAWNKIVAQFRSWLRDIGWVKEVSENDIQVLLSKSMDALRAKEGQGARTGEALSLKGKSKPDETKPEMTGIAHRVSEARGLGAERGQGISPADSVEHGRELLAKGANPQKAIDDFNKTKSISADAMAMVRAHVEEFSKNSNQAADDFGTNSPEYKAAWAAEKALIAKVKPMQTEWHKIGQAQQGETAIDTGTFHGLQRAYFEATGKDFTPRQVKSATETANRVKIASTAAETAKQKLYDQLELSLGKVDVPSPRNLDEARILFAKYESGKAFTPQQIKTLWNAARQFYLDRGITDFNDIRHGLATDFGMKVEDVTRALGQPKGVRSLTDSAWKRQTDARRTVEQAKRWIQNLQMPFYQRAIANVPRALFGLKVGFHGTVALGTHAPMVAFQPRFWNTYVRDFGKMYKMIARPGYYEMQVQDLLRRPNYITARRAGLVNDPFMFEDYNSPDVAKYFGPIANMGGRGYSILKILRQDMFDQHWNNLPKTAQIPEVAKAIADGLNHATGVVKVAAPKGANIALFAPRLEMSRVAWLATDPIRAADAFARWKSASPAEKYFAINQVKEKAWVAGTMFGLLALNQGFLMATGSKQQVNLDDPMKSDFLKFKVAGMTLSYGNAMLTMARLPVRLYQIRSSDGGKLKNLIHPDENTYTVLGEYARSQMSPFASLASSLWFKSDWQNRPLPNSNRPVPKRLAEQGVKPYTWPEFWTEQFLPIPAEEAAREVWKNGLGMSDEQVKGMRKAMATIAVMSATGARLTDDVPANGEKPKLGQSVDIGGKKYKVISFASDGEPLLKKK